MMIVLDARVRKVTEDDYLGDAPLDELLDRDWIFAKLAIPVWEIDNFMQLSDGKIYLVRNMKDFKTGKLKQVQYVVREKGGVPALADRVNEKLQQYYNGASEEDDLVLDPGAEDEDES